MSESDPTTTDHADAQSPPASKRDRMIKAAFLVVALVIVAWMIVQPHLTKPLPGWSNDLPAALEQAKAKGRELVVIMYDSPQDHTYNRLREVVSKPENRKAMDTDNILRVQARVSLSSPLAKQFDIKSFPTTLLLAPDGQVITRRVGYIPEVDYRAVFLKGEPPR